MYNEKFHRYSEVYTKEDVEMFDERFYGIYPSIKNYIKLINEKISVDELERFRENYIINQAFINEDKVFKIIYSKLEEIFNNKKYILLYQSKRLYRTRLNEVGRNLYEKDSMWNPPNGLPEQGRYNCHGKSILYCANNINILRKEIVAKPNQEYNFAIFRILKPMKMLPINLIFDDFEGFINDDSEENTSLKKKYIITNIIQMICEKIGYNGVAYESVKDGRYVNYGFFNFIKNEDIEIIKVCR